MAMQDADWSDDERSVSHNRRKRAAAAVTTTTAWLGGVPSTIITVARSIVKDEQDRAVRMAGMEHKYVAHVNHDFEPAGGGGVSTWDPAAFDSMSMSGNGTTPASSPTGTPRNENGGGPPLDATNTTHTPSPAPATTGTASKSDRAMADVTHLPAPRKVNRHAYT